MTLRSLCPNSFLYVSVSDLYIPTIIILVGNNEAVQFYFSKYINQNQTLILYSHQPYICSEGQGYLGSNGSGLEFQKNLWRLGTEQEQGCCLPRYKRFQPPLQYFWNLLTHLNPMTEHSVSILTRLTSFRPSVQLSWSWGAQSAVVDNFTTQGPLTRLKRF